MAREDRRRRDARLRRALCLDAVLRALTATGPAPAGSPEPDRYAAQLELEGWTEAVQQRLALATAIVIGAGALGSAAAAHLSAAGVGRLGIVDGGEVTTLDLHGGSLHFPPDVGRSRADSAAAKLGLLNPDVQAEAYPVDVEEANAEAIITGADVVVDCSAERSTRWLVNRACCATGTALVTGATCGPECFAISIRPGRSACHRCAFPDGHDPGSDALGAGLGAVVAVAGGIQAVEALKLLTGIGAPLLDRVLRLDADDWSHSLTPTTRREDCPACAGVDPQPQST